MSRKYKKRVTKKYYTAYDGRERVIAFGSAEQCAEMLGITTPSLYRAVCRYRGGKATEYEFVVEILDTEGAG